MGGIEMYNPIEYWQKRQERKAMSELKTAKRFQEIAQGIRDFFTRQISEEEAKANKKIHKRSFAIRRIRRMKHEVKIRTV
jgi:hypothetical protein